MKRMKFVLSLAAILCVIGQRHPSQLLAAEGVHADVTVEVLIFSGRPNPTWQLQDTNWLHALKAKLKDLPTAFESEPAGWSRLGFGAFLIRGGQAIGLPAEIRIYQGVIKTRQGKESKYLKDSQRLEASLLAEAKQQALPPPVKDAITRYED